MASYALLLTDVVDSTKLNERLGDARMGQLWAAHDRVARDLLVVHGGREIDRADGFLLLFEEASGALAYTRAYHAALTPLGIRARAGLHVGEVVLRENAAADVARGAKPFEVEGLAKSLAARVMSVASGGQTLVTPEAVDALFVRRVTPAPDGRVRTDGQVAVSHGHWQLKGLLDPIELFEVGVRGEAPFSPPPDAAKAWRVSWLNGAWLPVRQVKHHLPAERDAFVGRREDLNLLAERIDDGARLVSVLGIGGTGKTRLALHYGWLWLGSWPGGVWFCDLSEALSIDGIVYAVAAALDVPLGKDDQFVQLGHAIAGRGPCLVILDNFEQVARHAADTLGKWLDRAHEASFVVTTRGVLGLPGEQSLVLAPLRSEDAVALFDTRARSAHQVYTPDPATVRQLVTLLDGLPLAIELAAARVRLMPPTKLLERIGERFKLLTSQGARQDRQATLRATLDWSWDLLPPGEQQALAELSVFEGGFTLEAAEAVLSSSDLWPADAVQGLVDKSLVRLVSDDRFNLLVSVQVYASEKLDAFEGRSSPEARHGAYYASTFGTDEALSGLRRHGWAQRWRALARELDNLVAASRRAVVRRDVEVAAATALAAWAVLESRGSLSVGLAVLRAAREMDGHATPAVAKLDIAAGRALRELGRMDEALGHFEAAVATSHNVGDPELEGAAYSDIGAVHLRQGRMEEARAGLQAALALAPPTLARRPTFEGVALNLLGHLRAVEGRMDDAETYYNAALAVSRELGDRQLEGIVSNNLGDANLEQGRTELAREHLEAALVAAREAGARRLEGVALGNLGTLHRVAGDHAAAGPFLRAALAAAREGGHRLPQPVWLSGLALLDAAAGQSDEALAQAQEAVGLAEAWPPVLADALSALAQVHVARSELAAAAAAVARARALGQAGRVGAMIAASDALVAASGGHRAAAETSLAEATLDPRTCAPGSDVARVVERARAALDGVPVLEGADREVR